MKKEKSYYDQSMWKGAPPDNFRRAQNFRKNPTNAEKLLWEKLQLEPFKKFRFRRQHPIQKFITDFYSHSLKLIIEVDGGYHQSIDQKRSDEERTEILEFQGLQVIRFKNDEVEMNIEDVLNKLALKIDLLNP